jgi:hypothetical protein
VSNSFSQFVISNDRSKIYSSLPTSSSYYHFQELSSLGVSLLELFKRITIQIVPKCAADGSVLSNNIPVKNVLVPGYRTGLLKKRE